MMDNVHYFLSKDGLCECKNGTVRRVNVIPNPPAPSAWFEQNSCGLEVNLGTGGITVNVSCDVPVIIDKLYGPLGFASIRITAIFENAGWLIERQTMGCNEWVPLMIIPAQIELDDKEK